MTTHTFTAARWYNVIGTFPPALTVESGDTVVTETIDAHGSNKSGEQVATKPNPMNGPIAIAGARPGDSLKVEILDLRPISPTGWTYASLSENVVDPAFVKSMPPRERVNWRIDRNAQTALMEKPPAALRDVTFPLSPMIGCFGVAPALGQAISTATSGEHGGNMDYRRFGAGTTVWFPVAVEGALFFLGDCHALQGDGEICGTGIETCCEVTVRLTLEKRTIVWPRGETERDIFTIGNARPLEQALQHATTEMLRWLGERGLDTVSASHILGQAVRYDIGNIYDPAFTVACRLDKRWLAKP